MVIDSHTHIFPPAIVRGRERFFPEEPEFRLLYAPPRSKLATAEDLLEAMDGNGVDRSVVFGFPWRSSETLARHNDYVLESAAKYPNRLIALSCLDLLSENCPAQAENFVRQGVSGFGELAVYAGGSGLASAVQNFGHVADLCRKAGLVLLVHANEPVGHSYPGKAPFGLDFYYSAAKAAAGVKLILAHWGGGLFFFELLKREAPDVLARVYYDTAASPYLYRNEIYPTAARIVGCERILFGSDYPLLSPKRYFDEIESSGLSDSQIRAVLGENAAALFAAA